MFVVRIECYSWMLGKLAFVVFIKKKKKGKKIHLKIFTLKDRINAATKIYIRLNLIFFVGYINN